MRTVLITGVGGSGRTTVAAATALATARSGQRTLLLSTDRAGALDEVFHPAGPAPAAEPTAETAPAPWSPPTELAPRLWVARIATPEYFRSELASVQERARSVLDYLGANAVAAEEATELPGADAFALMATLRAVHQAADRAAAARAAGGPPRGWDVLVVDLPPAPEAIRLLGLPEQLGRYLRRLLPAERQASRALHPMLAQLAGVPVPAQRLYETFGRWQEDLAAVRQIIESDAVTVRLVAEPGPLAARALRAARAGLALHGCRVDAVIANRLLPVGSADPWLAAASGQQQAALKELREACGRGPAAPEHGAAAETTGGGPDGIPVPGIPVREVPHAGRDPRGLADLGPLADAIGPVDARPDRPAAEPWTVEDRLADEGLLVWRLPLDGAERDDLSLVRRGDELVVTVGEFRRVLPLPSALRRCTVAGAGLHEGALRVRFAPDPRLWPRDH
ncbi:ArsA family ATPase [Streptomyces sp. AC563]|uniref:ArsA family ATPase n=1 Tax=Streptomyces buecherae TaxID=2763006 RepID=UPI00164D8103|nr:ArsA family ATPase [Streptomyces buecherae]MBC3988636.1 ArsA family ATPase [Streptomyces buecherae]